MSDESRLPHGVMEGKGSYNKYAKLPAGGAALAMPLLEKAVRAVRLDPADRPFVIADYGSSQGKNSLAPLSVAIKSAAVPPGSRAANLCLSCRPTVERLQFAV